MSQVKAFCSASSTIKRGLAAAADPFTVNLSVDNLEPSSFTVIVFNASVPLSADT